MLGFSALSELPLSTLPAVVVTTDPGRSSAGLGSGGPAGVTGGSRRRRSVDFEKLNEQIDRTLAENEKERRERLERIAKTIEALIKGEHKQDEVLAPEEAAVIDAAVSASQDLEKALRESVQREQAQQSTAWMRLLKRPPPPPKYDIDGLKRRVFMLQAAVAAAHRAEELRRREIEEDDEDILMLITH